MTQSEYLTLIIVCCILITSSVVLAMAFGAEEN